jgi:hypothetical protein
MSLGVSSITRIDTSRLMPALVSYGETDHLTGR